MDTWCHSWLSWVALQTIRPKIKSSRTLSKRCVKVLNRPMLFAKLFGKNYSQSVRTRCLKLVNSTKLKLMNCLVLTIKLLEERRAKINKLMCFKKLWVLWIWKNKLGWWFMQMGINKQLSKYLKLWSLARPNSGSTLRSQSYFRSMKREKRIL